MKRTLILIAAGLTMLHAHDNQTSKLGAGSIRSYVTLSEERDANRQKIPLAIGIEVPEAVMNSLPQEESMHMLALPIQARATPFQYVMVNWNPNGHPPVGVYNLPHFDFHFYIQDMEEVMSIETGPCNGINCAAYAKATRPVPSRFVPNGYIDVGEVVPFMGNHLIFAASPELNGARFTRTFIYGAYDGQISFLEPMITRESMMKTPDQCAAIPLPAQYDQAGYYPTKYCTSFDKAQKTYRVALTAFKYRGQGLVYRTDEE